MEFDLLAYVPPHRAPRVVHDAGLVGESGWIGVDRQTLETRFENVYAIGDVVGIPLTLGKPLPKAGVFAHGEAEVVAANIARSITGKGESKVFEGHGECFIETGDGKAGLGMSARRPTEGNESWGRSHTFMSPPRGCCTWTSNTRLKERARPQASFPPIEGTSASPGFISDADLEGCGCSGRVMSPETTLPEREFRGVPCVRTGPLRNDNPNFWTCSREDLLQTRL